MIDLHLYLPVGWLYLGLANKQVGNMHSKITAAEAMKLESKTLTVPGQPNDYLIQLEVFHQLHCLNSIRQALWLPEVERYRHHFHDYYMDDGKRNFTGKGAKHIGKSFVLNYNLRSSVSNLQ